MNTTEITYPDAAELAGQIGELDGLSYMEAVRDGRLPLDPFAHAVGLRLTECSRGIAVFEVTVQPWQVNAGQIAHGGFLSTLMDHSCGLALHTTLEAGQSCPHAGASYRFARPAKLGSTLTCRGEVVHAGRTLGVTRCTVHDQDGRLICTGDATNAITKLFSGAAMA